MMASNPDTATILDEVRSYPPREQSMWAWSNFEECHRRRAGHWDDYRRKASVEPPVGFTFSTASESNIGDTVRYVDEKELVPWFRSANDQDERIRLALVFLSRTYSPFTPNISPKTLSGLSETVGGPPVLQSHYLSRVSGINERFPGPTDDDAVFLCSSGMCWLYPQSVSIRYNAAEDKVLGFIVADLGAFDHTALYGITSEAENCQHHPLLVPVLALERQLEVLCCDLEFYCIHTVRENVPLSREYSEKVPSYQSFFFGWRGRLSATKSTAEFLAKELDRQHEWLPMARVLQYSAASVQLVARVKRAMTVIEQFTRYSDDITGRMSAWQAGAFHKVAQENSDQNRRDSSTMKFLAFLGTVFLPMTFVSSFFSMPVFDWDAPDADGFVGSRFWLWWAVMVPLTLATTLVMYLWIRLKLGNRIGNDLKAKEIP